MNSHCKQYEISINIVDAGFWYKEDSVSIHIGRFHHENVFWPFCTFLLIQEEHWSINFENRNALNTSNLPPGGLPWNSVAKIMDCLDIASAVDYRCTALY